MDRIGGINFAPHRISPRSGTVNALALHAPFLVQNSVSRSPARSWQPAVRDTVHPAPVHSNRDPVSFNPTQAPAVHDAILRQLNVGPTEFR